MKVKRKLFSISPSNEVWRVVKFWRNCRELVNRFKVKKLVKPKEKKPKVNNYSDINYKIIII